MWNLTFTRRVSISFPLYTTYQGAFAYSSSICILEKIEINNGQIISKMIYMPKRIIGEYVNKFPHK
jgi:hypothetical protein